MTVKAGLDGIEIRKLDNGNVEVLLEVLTGGRRDKKRHVALFEVPSCEATDTIIHQLKLIGWA